MGRLDFQRQYVISPLLDVGSGENAAGFNEEETVCLDLDKWKHKYSVQADAHHLPFKENAFRTAVLGDILEHAVDPLQMLTEAKRVARRLVLTIFEEWRLGAPGQHIELGLKRAKEELTRLGYSTKEEYMRSYKPFEGKWIRGISEEKLPHAYHIWQFTDDYIKRLIEQLNMEVIAYRKEPEATHQGHTWFNWLICLEKENGFCNTFRWES